MRVDKYIGALLSLGSGVLGSQLAQVQNHFNIKEYPELDFWAEPISVYDDFEAVDFFRYTGQGNLTRREGEGNSSKSLIYYSDDTFISLGDIPESTKVKSIVPLDDHRFIISGSGRIGNQQLERQILYDLQTFEATEIFSQSLEDVRTIAPIGEKVYFGGNFTYTENGRQGHGVVQWDRKSATVSLLPFGGFNSGSEVNNIVGTSEDDVIFLGKFNGLDTTSNTTGAYAWRNTSSTKNVSEIEVNAQTPLRYSTWAHDGNLYRDRFVCPSGDDDAWQVNARVGEFRVTLLNQITPSKIRIYNSKHDDSEVQLFRIVTSPSRGIMNLTYVDPSTGQLEVCDAWCPLVAKSDLQLYAQNSTASEMAKFVDDNKVLVKWTPEYQEFAFVNHVPIEELSFIAIASYGESIGLYGMELFQNEYDTYMNNTLNQPNCPTENDRSDLLPLDQTEWYQGLPTSTYISRSFSSGYPSISVRPVIPYAGVYSLNLFTPGCLNDATCPSRGIVNVTVVAENGTVLLSRWIYQNNDYLKYDPLLTGHFTESPTVTLEWVQPIDPSVNMHVMVADRVTAIMNSLDSSELSFDLPGTYLNGIFKYSETHNELGTTNVTEDADIAEYAVKNLPSHSNLIGQLFNGSLFVSLPSEQHVVKLTPVDGNWDNVTSEVLDIQGSVNGIYAYSNGLVLSSNSNASIEGSSAVIYDGSVTPLPNLNSPVNFFANFTLDGVAELLIINDDYIFNVTQKASVSGSSPYNFSIEALASNSEGDTILAGRVLLNKNNNLKGYMNFCPNNISMIPDMPNITNGTIYMGGRHWNDAAAYAYYSTESNSTIGGIILALNDSQISYQSTNGAFVNDMLVFLDLDINEARKGTTVHNPPMAIVATNETATHPASLIFYNANGSMDSITQSFDRGQSINSLLAFRNNTILVGGSYSTESCSDLCFFNYHKNVWSEFLNGTIKGDIRDISMSNNGRYLAVGGNFTVGDSSAVNLATVDLVYNLIDVGCSSQPRFEGVIVLRQEQGFSYMGHDGVDLWYKSDGQCVKNTEFLNTTEISDLLSLQVDADSPIPIIHGNLDTVEYGKVNAMYFKDDEWRPYYISVPREKAEGSGIPKSRISTLDGKYNSNPLNDGTNGNGTIQNGIIKIPRGPWQRGYVVLLSLGLSLVTVALLGILGVTLAYFYGDHNAYEPLKPRIDEAEMLKTVPPEQLMKFI